MPVDIPGEVLSQFDTKRLPRTRASHISTCYTYCTPTVCPSFRTSTNLVRGNKSSAFFLSYYFVFITLFVCFYRCPMVSSQLQKMACTLWFSNWCHIDYHLIFHWQDHLLSGCWKISAFLNFTVVKKSTNCIHIPEDLIRFTAFWLQVFTSHPSSSW